MCIEQINILTAIIRGPAISFTLLSIFSLCYLEKPYQKPDFSGIGSWDAMDVLPCQSVICVNYWFTLLLQSNPNLLWAFCYSPKAVHGVLQYIDQSKWKARQNRQFWAAVLHLFSKGIHLVSCILKGPKMRMPKVTAIRISLNGGESESDDF